MAKLYIAFLFISFLLSSIFPLSIAFTRRKVDPLTAGPVRYAPPLHVAKKSAVLHFYVHDVGGNNGTVWEVAQAEITTNYRSLGQVVVMDHKLTNKPNKNSLEVGRVQGMVASTGLREMAMTLSMNFVFTLGKFKGSTLSVLGWLSVNQKKRELPVLGGTGVFRMARGYIISNTYSFDPIKNYGILEYTIYVYYT
ncbi:dirigent protein 22-like [Andrographis paniculata]|uniref:dirigent protein 22-like n=1 Tax=Andrographis paniculata TaxID=175694 RepID=UPI0021E6E32E|nr:dirigent protein 22-like [Andrographis paniculata]